MIQQELEYNISINRKTMTNIELKQQVENIKECFLYEIVHIPFYGHGQITYFADWYIEKQLKEAIETTNSAKLLKNNLMSASIIILITVINLYDVLIRDIQNNREKVEQFGILTKNENSKKLLKRIRGLSLDCIEELQNIINSKYQDQNNEDDN